MKRSIVNGENRGSINEILLMALQSGDKYGYEINKEIEIKSKGKYFIKEASLYSGLRRLESAGYITSYWKDGNLGIRRHYYSISEKGLEKLNNSNFSWDNSKEELMSGLFKNNNQTTSSKQMQMNIEEEKTIENASPTQIVQNKPNNPFAYVVSENQQNMFSMLGEINNEILKDKTDENANKEENLNKEEKLIEENSIKEEKIVEENAVKKDNLKEESEKIEEKNALEISNNIKETTQNENVKQTANFDELKKEIQFKNSYINNKTKRNNINIFDYIENSEQNASIVFQKANKKDNFKVENSKPNQHENLDNHENLENFEIKDNESKIENYPTFNLEDNKVNSNNFENNIIENNGNSNKDTLKDIFKNLMVEDIEQKVDETNKDEIEIEEEKSNETLKTELPRIKLENDVNVTLQTGKTTNYSKQYANSYTPTQTSKNSPSVKQYISKAKTLNLSNKNIEEDISLHGFKIREYTKMNSRTYKTSNYYYPNILNLFLISIVGGICLLESILGLIYANTSTFGVVLFSLALTLSLILIGLAIIKYDKDKYKVEIKNYNFKTSLFYFVMMFIVLTIILICVNILRGMNLNNYTSFARLLIFEIVISFNLVLYPIVKLILYRCAKFNN